MDDSSRVGQVRRLAIACALDQGLDEQATAGLAVAATELATNLIKHANAGEIHISGLSDRGTRGVEVLSIDRGPGIENMEACLADGYSSTGTPGTGLGAVARLSSAFDAYSQPGKGSVLVSHHYAVRRDESANGGPMNIAAVTVAIRGEDLCGDAWSIRMDEGRLLILVSDGLGHGAFAAQASSAAVEAFHAVKEPAPGKVVEALHRALKPTRGAAVAVASIDNSTGRVRFSGLGNIAGVVIGSGRPQSLLSHNGTAGHHSSRIQEFEYPLADSALVILHSDGLNTSWTLDAYPGLKRRHPAVIAGVLYRDASRQRDDACIVVTRSRQP